VSRLADLVSLVGLEPVLGIAVLVRENGHGLDAELVGGTEGANRDFAPVGYENLGEHVLEFHPGEGPGKQGPYENKCLFCQ